MLKSYKTYDVAGVPWTMLGEFIQYGQCYSMPATEAIELANVILSTYEIGTHFPPNRKERTTDAVVDAIPTPDAFVGRTAGGVEAASRLKLGDAFKNPSNENGIQKIYGVENVDLAKIAASAGVPVAYNKRT